MKNLSTVTQAIVDRLETNKTTLGLKEILFGDINLIAKVPTACVVPQTVSTEPSATYLQGQDEVVIYIVIYHGKIQDAQVNLKEALQFAEAVRDNINADKTMGGTVVFGFVHTVEAGVSISQKGDILLATRLAWKGMDRTTY